jgi:hypothetical protein
MYGKCSGKIELGVYTILSPFWPLPNTGLWLPQYFKFLNNKQIFYSKNWIFKFINDNLISYSRVYRKSTLGILKFLVLCEHFRRIHLLLIWTLQLHNIRHIPVLCIRNFWDVFDRFCSMSGTGSNIHCLSSSFLQKHLLIFRSRMPKVDIPIYRWIIFLKKLCKYMPANVIIIALSDSKLFDFRSTLNTA